MWVESGSNTNQGWKGGAGDHLEKSHIEVLRVSPGTRSETFLKATGGRVVLEGGGGVTERTRHKQGGTCVKPGLSKALRSWEGHHMLQF